MRLTRLRLNPRSPQVHRDLGDCVALHRTVMRGFGAAEPGRARDAFGVLHRVDTTAAGGLLLIVQSQVEPVGWDGLPAGYLLDGGVETRDATGVLTAIETGREFAFRLRANPTKRLSKDASDLDGNPGLKAGTRVGLFGLDARLGWLRRKAEHHGFELPMDGEQVVVSDRDATTERGRRGSRRLTFEGVTFDGRLRVRDADALRRAVCDGIGSGKAYGFGLLSLAPPGAVF